MSSEPFHPNMMKMEEGEQLTHDSLFPFTYNTSDYPNDTYQPNTHIYNRKILQLSRPPDEPQTKRRVPPNNPVCVQYTQKAMQSENGSDNSSIGTTTTSSTHTGQASPYSSNISTDPRYNWPIAITSSAAENTVRSVGSHKHDRSISDDQYTHSSDDNETEHNEEDSTDISNSVEIPSPENSYVSTHTHKTENNTEKGSEGKTRIKDPNSKLPLPLASIFRIMKRALPENAKVTKESKDKIQESVREFIEVITNDAIRHCSNDKRKTINGDDILWAMREKGLLNYSHYLSKFLDRLRKDKKSINGSQYLVPGPVSMQEFGDNQPNTVNRFIPGQDGYHPVLNSFHNTPHITYQNNNRVYNYQDMSTSPYSLNMNDYYKSLYKPDFNHTHNQMNNYSQTAGTYPSNMNSARAHMPENTQTQMPLHPSKIHLNMSNIINPNLHTHDVPDLNSQDHQPSTHSRNKSYQPLNGALYVNTHTSNLPPYNFPSKPSYINQQTMPSNLYLSGNTHRMNELILNNANNTPNDINNIHKPRPS